MCVCVRVCVNVRIDGDALVGGGEKIENCVKSYYTHTSDTLHRQEQPYSGTLGFRQRSDVVATQTRSEQCSLRPFTGFYYAKKTL